MKLRVFIPSYNRAATLKSHLLCERLGLDYTLVVHSKQDKVEYLQNPTVKKDSVIVSGVPTGNAAQRNFILEELVDDKEWFVMMDDNVEAITSVGLPHYYLPHVPAEKAKRSLFNNEVDSKMWGLIVHDTITQANKVGARFCGFATTDNGMFRAKKFRSVGLIVTKIALIQKTSLRFDERLMAKVDFDFTAQHLLKYGAVVINNFVYRKSKHYEAGGIGPRSVRDPYVIAASKLLMEKYPGLFRYNLARKNSTPYAEVSLRMNNANQIAAWRLGMKVNA